MVTHILRCFSTMLLGIVAASSIAVAQVSDATNTTPKITSVSKMTTAQHQTVTITGSGFGTHTPYTGVSNYISLLDQTKRPIWEAGYAPDIDQVTLIVQSWTDTKITLGGFAGSWGQHNWTLSVGDKERITIWNAQGPGGPFRAKCTAGCAVKTVRIVAAFTSTQISSSPNPSVNGQSVTITAVVTSGDGVPPDGGKVLFLNGEENLGTGTLHGGVARIRTSRLDFGDNSIRAVYSGDANFAGTARDEESAAEKHTVN